MSKLPTVGYRTEFEREHLDSKGVVVRKNEPRDAKERDNVHELVRRQDVIDLIDSTLNQVYEVENNASAEQEIATAEMLMKILEDVREKQGERDV